MGGKAKGGSGGGSGKGGGGGGSGKGGGGAAKGGGGGNSSKGSGGGRDSMKAPGGGGGYISRGAFESNPQGYFSGLHSADKAKSGGSTLGGGSSNSNKGRVMKAPGGGGSHISRQVFENNPKSYFADLRAGQNKDTQTSSCHIM